MGFEEKKRVYQRTAQKQIAGRSRWMMQPLMIALFGLCVLLTVIIVAANMFFEGKDFKWTYLLPLLFAALFLALIEIIYWVRARRSTQEDKIKNMTGRLVDASEMLHNASDDVRRFLTSDFFLEDDELAVSVTSPKSLKGSYCLCMVPQDHYQKNLDESKKNSEHDLLLDADLLQILFFFTYDKQLIKQAKALCTDVVPAGGHNYRVYPGEVTVTYTDVENTDRALLEIHASDAIG